MIKIAPDMHLMLNHDYLPNVVVYDQRIYFDFEELIQQNKNTIQITWKLEQFCGKITFCQLTMNGILLRAEMVPRFEQMFPGYTCKLVTGEPLYIAVVDKKD